MPLTFARKNLEQKTCLISMARGGRNPWFREGFPPEPNSSLPKFVLTVSGGTGVKGCSSPVVLVAEQGLGIAVLFFGLGLNNAKLHLCFTVKGSAKLMF